MPQIVDSNSNNVTKNDFKGCKPDANQSENVSKTQFQIECETAISIEEAETRLLSFVRNLPWKK